MNHITKLIIGCALFVSSLVHGQDSLATKEIGLFATTQDQGITYRFGSERKLWNFSLYRGAYSGSQHQNRIGFEAGREWRYPLSSRAFFRFGGGIGYSFYRLKKRVNNNGVINYNRQYDVHSLYLYGFAGINYDITRRFSLGLSFKPYAGFYQVNYSNKNSTPTENKSGIHGFNVFNSNRDFLELSLAFRLGKRKK